METLLKTGLTPEDERKLIWDMLNKMLPYLSYYCRSQYYEVISFMDIFDPESNYYQYPEIIEFINGNRLLTKKT